MTVGQVLTVLVAVFVVCYGDDDRERCLRFGGGACCPVVTPFNSTIQQVRNKWLLYTTILNGVRRHFIDRVWFLEIPIVIHFFVDPIM